MRPGGSLRLLRGVGRFLFEIVGFGACAFFSKSCPGLAVTPKIYRQVCGLDLGRCEPTGFDGKEAISRRTRRTRRTRTRTRTRRTTTSMTGPWGEPFTTARLLYPHYRGESNLAIQRWLACPHTPASQPHGRQDTTLHGRPRLGRTHLASPLHTSPGVLTFKLRASRSRRGPCEACRRPLIAFWRTLGATSL